MTSNDGQTDYLMDSFPPIGKVLDPDRTGAALRRMFDEFVRGTIPNDDYTIARLTRFVRSLVRRQRGVGKFIVKPGSWSLISLNEGAPSDVRVDYVFFPTYYAVSLLTLFLQLYPERVSRIKGYGDVLHKGFLFASMRQLWGHGIEGGEQRDEAVDILMRGGVPEYLRDNANEYPECRPLLDAISDYAKELEKRIDPKIMRMYLRLSSITDTRLGGG